MDFLAIFPVELIEKIFSHLTSGGILKATLISPKANRIISNSAELMQNCRCAIRSFGTDRITRKYCQLDFIQLTTVTAVLPVQDWTGKLIQLTFDGCRINIEDLYAFLSQHLNSLELLIINSCNFNIGRKNNVFTVFAQKFSGSDMHNEVF